MYITRVHKLSFELYESIQDFRMCVCMRACACGCVHVCVCVFLSGLMAVIGYWPGGSSVFWP